MVLSNNIILAVRDIKRRIQSKNIKREKKIVSIAYDVLCRTFTIELMCRLLTFSDSDLLFEIFRQSSYTYRHIVR